MHRLTLQVLGGTALVIAAIWGLSRFGVPDLADFRSWAAETGSWFPLVFFTAYVLFTLLPIPRSIFTIACGIFFTPLLGITVALAATTVSAAISFILVRLIARDRVEQLLPDGFLSTVSNRLQARGWLAVGSMRMIAAIPFAPLNYALALTGIRFWPYLVATAVGSAPNTIAVILLADAVTGGHGPGMLVVTTVLLVLGLLGLILDIRMPVNDNVKDPS